MALAYWKGSQLPVVIGRLFNTVGPRQTGRYGMIIPTFVRQALAGQPITVHRDGTQQRCFCHVRDVVKALADLMSTEEAFGEVYNLGSTDEIAIRDLASKVRAAAESDSEIVMVPYGEAYEEGFEDMRRRVPDLTKIRQLLGWQPTLTLDDVLTDVVESNRTSSPLEAAI